MAQKKKGQSRKRTRPEYSRYLKKTAQFEANKYNNAPRMVDIKKEAKLTKKGQGVGIGDVTQASSFWYSPELTMESWLLPKILKKSTLVVLSSGKSDTLGNLAAKDARNFEVQSYNFEEKKFEIQHAHSVQCHGRNVEFLKVVFSDGSFIEAAKEHAFYLMDGSEVATRFLKKGDSILTPDKEPLLVKKVEAGSTGDGYDAVNVTNNYNYVVLTSSGRKIVTRNSRQEILKWNLYSDKLLTFDGLVEKKDLVDKMRFVSIANDTEESKQLKRIRYTGDIVKLTVREFEDFPFMFTYGHPILILRDGQKPHRATVAGHNNALQKFTGELLSECTTVPAENITTRDWVVLPRFTEEKPLPVIDLWKYIQNIQGYSCTDDQISYCKGQKYTRYVKWTPEFFTFLGWYAAEGWGGGTSIGLALHVDETPIAELLGKYITEEYGGTFKITPGENNNGICLHINNHSLASFLSESFGKGACYKRLPDWLMFAPKENVIRFLKGWLEGDGTAGGDRAKLEARKTLSGITGSKVMGGQLFWLFTKVNIMPYFALSKPPKPNYIKGELVKPSQEYYINIQVFGNDLEVFFEDYEEKYTIRKYLRDENYFYLPVSKVEYEHVVDGEAYDFLTADTMTASPILNFNCKSLGDLITQVKPEEIRALNFDQQVLGAQGKFTPIVNKSIRNYTGEICKVEVKGLPSIEVPDAKVLLGIKVVRGHWTNSQQKEFTSALKSKTYPLEKYLTWITASLLKADDILVVPKSKEHKIERFDLGEFIPKVKIRKHWFYEVSAEEIEVTSKRARTTFTIPRFISSTNCAFMRLVGVYLSGGFDSKSELTFSRDISKLVGALNIPKKLVRPVKFNLYSFCFPIFRNLFFQYFGTGSLQKKKIPSWCLNLSKEASQALLEGIFGYGDKRIKDSLYLSSKQKADQLYLIGLRAGRVLYRRNVGKQIVIKNETIPALVEDDNFTYVQVQHTDIEKVQNKKLVELTTGDNSLALPVVGHNCRLFYNLEPYLQGIITMHAYYPFSKFDLTCEDKEVEDFYKEQTSNAKFDLFEFILQSSLSYQKFGEAIPFGSMGEREDKRFKFVWDSYILLEPELVEIKQSMFQDEPEYELIPTEELKGLVKKRQVGQSDLEIDDVIVEAIEEGRNIPLDPRYVSPIQRITDPSASRGTPVIQCCFKPLILQDFIRLAQMAIATRYHFPVELWTVGDPANDIWPTETELEEFRNMINQAIQNPPTTLVYPPIIGYEALSVLGKLLPVSDDYEYIQDQIMVGLGVNKNLIKGEGPSFSNTRTVSLEKLVMEYQIIRDKFENWMINHFYRPLAVANKLYVTGGEEKKFILPQIHWYKDLDAVKKDMIRKDYIDLHAKGMLSTKTLFAQFPDLDYDQEQKLLEKERNTIFDDGKRIPREFEPSGIEEKIKKKKRPPARPVKPEKPEKPEEPEVVEAPEEV